MTKKSICYHFLLLLSVITITMVFQENLFGIAEQKAFDSFQRDAEAVVIGGVVANIYNLPNKGPWNLGSIARLGPASEATMYDSYSVFTDGAITPDMDFAPYKSQFGLLGILYSKLQD